VLIRSLWAPSHIHTHGHVVLHRNCHQRRRVELEVGQLRRNRSRNARLVPVHRRLKRHVLVLRSLPGEFDLHVAVDARRRQSRLRRQIAEPILAAGTSQRSGNRRPCDRGAPGNRLQQDLPGFRFHTREWPLYHPVEESIYKVDRRTLRTCRLSFRWGTAIMEARRVRCAVCVWCWRE
jgi:hypothetical protein